MSLYNVVEEAWEAYQHRDCCESCRDGRLRWHQDVRRSVVFGVLAGILIGWSISLIVAQFVRG